METTTATRARKKLAERFDIAAPIVPHQYYPAEYVAALTLIHHRAVRLAAEEVRDTGKQSPSIPRPSWIKATTKQGEDKLRFRGVDILNWQDQIAGLEPSTEIAAPARASTVRLPKRRPKTKEAEAA